MRELEEETGLSAINWRHIGESGFTYPDRLLHFVLFTCVCEHTAGLQTETLYAWVSLNALTDYPMPEANAALINMLITAKNNGA